MTNIRFLYIDGKCVFNDNLPVLIFILIGNIKSCIFAIVNILQMERMALVTKPYVDNVDNFTVFQKTSTFIIICQHLSTSINIYQHLSTSINIRQQTSTYIVKNNNKSQQLLLTNVDIVNTTVNN